MSSWNVYTDDDHPGDYPDYRTDNYSCSSRLHRLRQDVWNEIHFEWWTLHRCWVHEFWSTSSTNLILSLTNSGNAYWIGLTGLSTANMNAAFADIAKAGGTTVRTWYDYLIPIDPLRFTQISHRGFNEVTSQNGNWFQSWSGKTATINTGSTGLGNFGA